MIKKRSKWCFATGCTGRDMCYNLVSMFFLMYVQYTNLMNKTQYAVLTTIIVICRVWDAVNDPMMGTIISNTKTKFGKYRPWVLIGALANAVFLICMFAVRVDVGNNIDTLGWYNVAILGVCYLFWGMTFTMNDVSYWSLLPVLSNGKEDRDKLTTMVAIFASVGAFVAGGLVPMLTPNDAIIAYRNIAIVFTAIFVLSQMMVFFFVHDNEEDKFTIEKSKSEAGDKNVNLKDMVKILIRNKQLLIMAAVVLLYTLAGGLLVAFGQNFFYFKFEYGGNQVFIFTVMYALGTIGSQAIFPMLAKKFKRMSILRVCMIAVIVGYTLFFVVANLPLDNNLAFILICCIGMFVFLGQGIFYMIMLVMLANTIEYDEWKHGERNDAVTFSVRSFMVKLAGAFQAFIVSAALIASGLYDITQQVGVQESIIAENQGNAEKIAEATEKIKELIAAATDGQMMILSTFMTAVPVVLLLVMFILIKKKYIITEDLYDQMVAEIAARKENVEVKTNVEAN
jgi:melibiose permease/lactose/raffinose/galactose permease